MSVKDFKIKSGLVIGSLSSAGVITTDSSGNISSNTTLGISQGGTGQTTAPNALNALLPLQTGSANYFLQTNQTTAQWSKVYNQTIKNAGTTVTPRGILNIVGGTFADDSLNDITTLTIPTGYVSTSGGSTITASSDSIKPLVLQGATSQTADLQQWQNSAGTLLSRIGSDGRARIGGANGIGTGITASAFGAGGIDPSWTVITAKGAASQTADLQQWQNSAGTVLASIDPNGQLRTPQILNVASFNNSRLQMTSTGALFDVGVTTNVVLRVKGAASQTANLQEWQDSTGAIVAAMWSSGTFSTAGRVSIGNGSSGAKLDVLIASSTQLGLVVKGVTSQTADLQQWQNPAGTVLSKVDSTGAMFTITPADSTNTTQVATTAYVKSNINNLINSAPGTLDTLSEIAAALNNDPNFYSTITTLTTALSGQDTYSLMGVF